MWNKYHGGKLVLVQLAIIWIFPMLIWIAAWVDDIDYDTGSGMEDGRVCYAKEDGERVFLTRRQFPIMLFVEISILVTILLSCGILFYQFRKQTYEERDAIKDTHQIRLLRFNLIAAHKKRSLNTSIGIICAAYVILRLPYILITSTHLKVGEDFSYGFYIGGSLYIVRFCMMAFLLGFSNKNYRRAYLDILKIFSCATCCTKK